MAKDPATAAPAAPSAAEEEPPLFILQRQFPRIASAIELLWGDRELDGYLQKLILADRGDRAGFPKEVLAALLKLYNQHHARFNFPSPEDKWAQADRIDRVKFRPERR
jgi:hypothetical protein